MRGLGDLLRERSAPAAPRHSARQPKGYVIITDPDAPTREYDTLQCVHCQAHWKVIPGSGRQRGYCLNCDGPTCGKKDCEEKCIPFEKAIEAIEARSRLDQALRHIKEL